MKIYILDIELYLIIMPTYKNPLEKYARSWLDNIQPDLWDHLDKVPTLTQDIGIKILRYFLEPACQAQSWNGIMLGRETIFKNAKRLGNKEHSRSG